MKKGMSLSILAICMVCILLSGCNSIQYQEKEYTKAVQQQIKDKVGDVEITNGFEYAQLKEIYEMRDNPNLICYWYTKNDYTGKWVYQGECIGYGIPYGSSITNPEQYYNSVAIPLAEPNGLYNNGASTSATWILSCDEEGNIKPIYVESEITVSQTKIDANRCEDWSLPENY